MKDTTPVSYEISGWMPYGPFKPDKNDPLGWIDEKGLVHSGTWSRDKKGNIMWGENHRSWKFRGE